MIQKTENKLKSPTVCADFFGIIQRNNPRNKNGVCLNLVFSNLLCDILSLSISLVSEDLHHPSLSIITQFPKSCSLSNKQTTPTIDLPRFNFKAENYPIIFTDLAT